MSSDSYMVSVFFPPPTDSQQSWVKESVPAPSICGQKLAWPFWTARTLHKDSRA